jgi:thiol-disulfide isomerase/thioredoxin
MIISLAVALVLSVLVGWLIARSRHSDVATLDPSLKPPTIGTNRPVKGERLPSITLSSADGTQISTDDLVGQPMVINVWGSTCGPCKKELPDFAAAHLDYGDRVRFVGVDYLPPSDLEEQFARSRGVQYELLYDATGDFVNTMEIAAFPITLFVAADGTIVQQTGQLDRTKLTALIESDLL